MPEVWVSSVMKDHSLGNKLGIRGKYYGHDWEPPTHIIPPRPPGVFEAHRRHRRGEMLERSELPEASYVFSAPHFKRAKDLFFAGPFRAVKGKLANVLAQSNLSPGGLIPYTIYEQDKTTPLEGPFFLLNFGAMKDSFLPHDSTKIEPFFTIEKHGVEVWNAGYDLEDGDIAVSQAALAGADLWFEPRLREMIFMSGGLVAAIRQARVNLDFGLAECRIVGERG